MIPPRPILDLWPGDPDIPEDEPSRDEDLAHEESEWEDRRERNIEDGIWA